MPSPSGLVVKKGSNARAATSGAMPSPVSLTQIETYWPGSRSWVLAVRASIQRLPVSTVSRPPFGMASRALMHRFSTAFSSWCASISTGHRPVLATTSNATPGPVVRRIRSSIPRISRLGSVGLGSRVWRRENASSRCVRAAARFAAPCAAAVNRSTSP